MQLLGGFQGYFEGRVIKYTLSQKWVLSKGKSLNMKSPIFWDITASIPFKVIRCTYLRSWALLEEPPTVQPLKNIPAFIEPEGSIQCSQEPFTGPYPEPYQSNPLHPILSKIHFNIVHHLRLASEETCRLYLRGRRINQSPARTRTVGSSETSADFKRTTRR
jgi:hypothetical protein